MDNKKSIERECLEKTQNYISNAPNASKYILGLLSGRVIESERPDFLIENESGVIGAEHFLVDTLIGKKKAARSRTRESELQRIFNKYHDNIYGNEEKALKEVELIVQSDIDAIQNFEYQRFISEFKRIVMEHSDRVIEYKRLHSKLYKIVFLIEIPIPKNKIIGISTSHKQEEIKGRRFPITDEMLKVLKSISCNVDYVIISVMHENYKRYPYVVYAFDSSRFEDSIKMQIKEIYRSFTFDWQTRPIKARLKLSLEKTEDQ